MYYGRRMIWWNIGYYLMECKSYTVPRRVNISITYTLWLLSSLRRKNIINTPKKRIWKTLPLKTENCAEFTLIHFSGLWV